MTPFESLGRAVKLEQDALLEREQLLAAQRNQPRSPPVPPHRRRRWALLVMVGAALAVLVAVGWLTGTIF